MIDLYYPHADDAGTRLDVWLSDQLEDQSRSYLQKLIRDGCVLADGSPVKSNYRIRGGETLSVDIPEAVPLAIEAEDIPLSILYEDRDLVFVDKPRGMVVHPAAGHLSGTLVNALLYHCGAELSGINGALRPGIVHRIVMDTSGVIVICKNDAAHRKVAEQFAVHSITRRYLAICHGSFPETEGVVDAPIGRSRTDRKKMAVVPDGKRAVTHYRVLCQTKQYALVQLQLETGRTHQIRVHMTKIGHPLLGDTVYGNRPNAFHAQAQTLHAAVLGLVHPATGEYLECVSPLPPYFTDLAGKCGLSLPGQL